MPPNSLKPTSLSVTARGIGFFLFFIECFWFFYKRNFTQINTLYRLFKKHTSNPLIYNSAAICPGRELAGMMHWSLSAIISLASFLQETKGILNPSNNFWGENRSRAGLFSYFSTINVHQHQQMRADRQGLAWLVCAGVPGGFVLFIYLKSYQNCNKDSTVTAVNSTGGTSLLPPPLPCAIYIKLHL